MFPQHPGLPHLWSTLAPEGTLWGDQTRGSSARTNSVVPYSLPGYQSIFIGQQTTCDNNRCPAVTAPTFLDRFRAEGGPLGGSDVAVFASWAGLSRAVSREPLGSAPGIGAMIHADIPPWGEPEIGLPWENARWDSTTWTKALAHLQASSPRLLVISLLDTDEYAHAGHEDGYRSALLDVDARLGALVESLQQSGRWAETTLVLTTDHGRNRNWRRHGDDDKGRDVFVGVFGRRAPRLGRATQHNARPSVTHADVRPTIEDALGLTPMSCAGCGRSLLAP